MRAGPGPGCPGNLARRSAARRRRGCRPHRRTGNRGRPWGHDRLPGVMRQTWRAVTCGGGRVRLGTGTPGHRIHAVHEHPVTWVAVRQRVEVRVRFRAETQRRDLPPVMARGGCRLQAAGESRFRAASSIRVTSMLLSERRSAAAIAASFACTSSGTRALICFMPPVWGYTEGMSKYRLYPGPEQQIALLEHCMHARFMWNLAVEQHEQWKPGRKSAPGFAEQCRQLTEARQASDWLRSGPVNVQQQALRDFWRAKTAFFKSGFGHPTWRRRYRDEGFRITDTCEVRKLNRRWAQVKVPKIGWVRK